VDDRPVHHPGTFTPRLLLTAINGTGFFVTMVAVGMPVGLAIPLAIFGGFVSEFIPNIGTYLGGSIPIGLTLAIEGFVPALIVLAYVVVYQQLENYWLAPKISAKTMELNGGLAFGAALAGGALFGPMGAFMALPVAALISSFNKNYRRSHEVVYESQYAGDGEADDPGASVPSSSRGASDPGAPRAPRRLGRGRDAHAFGARDLLARERPARTREGPTRHVRGKLVIRVRS
jgi:hypothetical protein